MFVGQANFGELILIFALENIGENVLERTIVGLEDRVLRRQEDRIVALESIFKGCSSEVCDRFVEVVHAHRDATTFRHTDHFVLNRFRPIVGSEGQRDGARSRNLKVSRTVLVAECVSTDNDRLGPSGDEARNVVNNDWFTEDNATKNIANRAVGATPHLLQAELFNTRLIGSDCRALDAHAMLFDRIGGINRHLVVSRVAILDRQVVVTQINIQVGVDQTVFNELPHDAGHFVAIEFNDRACNLHFRHRFSFRRASWRCARNYLDIKIS